MNQNEEYPVFGYFVRCQWEHKEFTFILSNVFLLYEFCKFVYDENELPDWTIKGTNKIETEINGVEVKANFKDHRSVIKLVETIHYEYCRPDITLWLNVLKQKDRFEDDSAYKLGYVVRI